MDYVDLVIHLAAGPFGSYTARVARSPAGESEPEPLAPPLAPAEIDRFAAALGRAARDLRPPGAPELREPALAEMGERLFRALFTGTVRNRFHESVGRILARGSCGLRLRIEISLNSPAMAWQHMIPWEYLRLPDDGHFLGLRRDISIVRYLDLPLAGERSAVPPPLAVLVLAGEDPAGGDLALGREHRALVQAWREGGPAHVDLLEGASLDMLREALLAREYHVLHFMGHGGFDPAAGEGSLALRDRQGRRSWVKGAELGEHLRDRASLRLVFLNACWTARAASTSPYAGVATGLLCAGVPAVLAMQFAVSDGAALAFSRAFYRRLARGDTIDAAVTEGRMAIRRLRSAAAEWGTPALFQRLDTGRMVAAVRPRALPRRLAAAGLVAALAFLAWWRLPPLAIGPAGGPLWSLAFSQHERAPARGDYLLKGEDSVFIEQIDGSVSAEFFQLGNEQYLTLHVSQAGSAPIHRAILGPSEVDLGAGRGRLVVQSIDWAAQTVQLVAERPAS